jgi:hypothetical protein
LNVCMSRRKLFHLFWAFDFSIFSALPRGVLHYGYPHFTWFFGVQIGLGHPVSKSWELLIQRLLFRVEIEIPFLRLYLIDLQLV